MSWKSTSLAPSRGGGGGGGHIPACLTYLPLTFGGTATAGTAMAIPPFRVILCVCILCYMCVCVCVYAI